MYRVIEPELLDALLPIDRRAIGSRADLRRLNFLMGHMGVLTRAIRRQTAKTSVRSRPVRLVELGAGDGTFLLRMAHRLAELGLKAEATLVDRQSLVAAKTRCAFTALQWSVENVAEDVFDWMDQPLPAADIMFANLFLHHFPNRSLRELLRLAAERTNLFIACEPRRSWLPLTISRCLLFMGCNGVTRHDAVVSVRAGFARRELSALWPSDHKWQLTEGPAGFFSHCFIAKRNA